MEDTNKGVREEGEIGIKKGKKRKYLEKGEQNEKKAMNGWREKLCVVTSHVFQPMPKQALVMTIIF